MKWTNKNVPKHCQMAKMENNQYISPSDYWQANIHIMVPQFSLKNIPWIFIHFRCQFSSLYWNKINQKMVKKWKPINIHNFGWKF
jgi:hypothetical protein